MSKKFTLIPLVAALFSGSLFASVEAAKLEDLPVLKQESQHGTASKRVANLFARSHYTPVRFNDGLSSKVYDRYIESLDFNKSVFLASDIAAFEKYRNDFDNSITQSNAESPPPEITIFLLLKIFGSLMKYKTPLFSKFSIPSKLGFLG